MTLLSCPKCSNHPHIQRYKCAIQNVQMIRIACKNQCSSTFATKNKEAAFELWNSFVNYFTKNPERLKNYTK